MPHGIRKETYDEWLQRYYEYRYGSVIPVNDDVRRTPMFITADQIEPAYGSGVLLLIALGAVALLLLLIMRFKIHAFVALVLVSLLTALATKISYADVVPTLLGGFGSTLASVALLVGFGAMIGRLLEVTGGAQVLADTLINRFGEKRAPLALGVASLLFGFPIFFDAGLVVMLPIIFSVARRFGGSVRLLAPETLFFRMLSYVPPLHLRPARVALAAMDRALHLVGPCRQWSYYKVACFSRPDG